MKKLAIFFSIMLLFSCEDVIEIEVPSSEPKLVVDAFFEVYYNQTPITANTVVKLRESTDYFEEQIPIEYATVILKDAKTKQLADINANDLDGNFEPITPFIPLENIDYELNIFYNGEVYKSTANKIKTSGFSEVYQGNSTLFTGEEIEVNVSFIDDVNTETNYLFNFSNDLFLPIQDRFFNGSTYNFSFYLEVSNLPSGQPTIIFHNGAKDYLTYLTPAKKEALINLTITDEYPYAQAIVIIESN